MGASAPALNIELHCTVQRILRSQCTQKVSPSLIGTGDEKEEMVQEMVGAQAGTGTEKRREESKEPSPAAGRWVVCYH